MSGQAKAIGNKQLLENYLRESMREAVEQHLTKLAEDLGDCLISLEMMESLIAENEEELRAKLRRSDELAKQFDALIGAEITSLRERVGWLVLSAG